jgi:UDP-N-acetylmuramoylalanine--D-glutamate ligase
MDLFFLKNKVLKSVIITGTNGKSTTCSLINHILKNNKIQNQLAGNIGRPILDIRFTKRDTYIIEASSFQLEYSQFIKPNCAAILNISLDHLDWHGSKKKYINSKIKIFKNQTKKDVAFLNDNILKKIYKKNKYLGKLRFIKDNPVKPKEINNSYLKLEANKDNLKFAYFIAKYFNINKNNFIKSLKTFNGLSHRHEIFLKHDNVTFINDSKATSFEATKYALKSNDNIIWIVGGQPKKNDKINVNQFKNKIIKAYVIGNHTNFFIKQIYKKINYEVSKDLKTAVKKILRYDKGKKNITVLFSPASASYDQYSNFVERGESFKNLVKDNVKKYI